jgi:hypothetical protein
MALEKPPPSERLATDGFFVFFAWFAAHSIPEITPATVRQPVGGSPRALSDTPVRVCGGAAACHNVARAS